jgi:internalin A
MSNKKISDIKPLQSLTGLTSLNLEKNQLTDIKPLQSLTELRYVYLSGNPLSSKTCPLQEGVCTWELLNYP